MNYNKLNECKTWCFITMQTQIEVFLRTGHKECMDVRNDQTGRQGKLCNNGLQNSHLQNMTVSPC